jgi:hypothetical protein
VTFLYSFSLPVQRKRTSSEAAEEKTPCHLTHWATPVMLSKWQWKNQTIISWKIKSGKVGRDIQIYQD